MKKKRFLGVAFALFAAFAFSSTLVAETRKERQVAQNVASFENAAKSLDLLVDKAMRKSESSDSDESQITSAMEKWESAAYKLGSYDAVEVFKSNDLLMDRYTAAYKRGSLAIDRYTKWLSMQSR